jgi:hypothetical protein
MDDNEQQQLVIGRTHQFPEGYKDALFTLWYSKGKPAVHHFMRTIPPCEEVFGLMPGFSLLKTWVKEFRERAVALDAEVFNQIGNKMIAEKVEMLQRHATVGTEMQNMAMEYLKDHKGDLGISSAVRLLVAGVEIERESRGIATTVEKIAKMNDEELEEEIQKLISRSPVELLPGGEEEEDANQ